MPIDCLKLAVTEMKLDRPTVHDVAPLAKVYCAKPGNGAGGNLHLVLGNGNVNDNHVRFCLDQAKAAGDPDGVELATKLLSMTRTQRHKVAAHIY